MALSEHEQKLLEQMEQALYAEDPRFASRIRTQSIAGQSRRMAMGIVGILVALGLVVAAALNQAIWLGAIAFALMVAVGVWAFAPTRRSGPAGVVDPSGRVKPTGKAARPAAGDGFMQRIEERWDRRSHDE
ncbi:MAG: DUF3040 domain-containing protein [Dermatophilaceae bacterium]|nr:DUF3040 domain-containing protein [Actinomycetales bacterium]MBP8880505.1 DUF3040 domain-containing protein [Dermatophilaceae bacterium]MBP9917894.1 DUF3040 domain-containing protein [Dermatophilaceae bacterium]